MSQKTNGVSGRSSNKTIRKRHQICQDLYLSMYETTLADFLAVYEKCIRKNKMEVPSRQTLLKDIKTFNFTFINGFGISDPAKTALCDMAHKINYNLKQIRINCAHIDIVLYDFDTFSTLTSQKNFYKSFDKLKSAYKKDADSAMITDTSLVSLSFILKRKGFESYIESTFDRNCKIMCNYLYSEIHNYCTKIILEYKELDKIINYVYSIICELNVYD